MSWRVRLRWLPGAARLLCLGLIVVALARPQDVTGLTSETTEGVAIQLVIDRSASMSEEFRFDGQPTNRLEVVKQICSEFVLGNDRGLGGRADDLIGLVAFAGFADTICPLVRQHETLVRLSEGIELAPNRAPEGGTAIGDAIALAAARLKSAEEQLDALREKDGPPPDYEIKSKIIVLLTDGRQNVGDIDALDAARKCAEWDITIYAVGIGDSSGNFLYGMQSAIDERTLKEVARLTEGRYWRANTADAIREVYAEIDRLEKSDIESVDFTETEERYGPWALAALWLVMIEVTISTLVFRRVP